MVSASFDHWYVFADGWPLHAADGGTIMTTPAITVTAPSRTPRTPRTTASTARPTTSTCRTRAMTPAPAIRPSPQFPRATS
ncbi:MAG: hypothetical protein R2851_20670 [Caldilineaceae bacterium]